MKILNILSNGQTKFSDDMISVQTKDNEVKIVDLTKKDATYESIVDDIFSFDKVISW